MRFGKYKKLISNYSGRIKPDPSWKSDSRDFLLSQIRRTNAWKEPISSSFFGSGFSIFSMHILKPAIAVFLVFSISAYSSVTTAQAAKASLPGDTLYPVKLGIEQVQVGLVFSEERKAELEVKFAGTRIEEVKEIIENQAIIENTVKNTEQTQKNIQKAMDNFSDNLGSIKKRLEKINENTESQEKALQISKLVNEKTTKLEENLLEIKEKISTAVIDAPIIAQNIIDPKKEGARTQEETNNETQESNQNQEISSILENIATTTGDIITDTSTAEVLVKSDAKNQEPTSSEKLIETLNIALEKVDETNTKSLEVFVGKASASNNQDAKKDAYEKIQDKVQKIEEKIIKTEEKIEKINTAQKADSALIVPLQGSSVSSTTASVIGTTTSESLINQQIKETQEKPKQAKETILEVKKMLDDKNTDQLNQAVEKVMQAKETIKQADENIKTVEQKIIDGVSSDSGSTSSQEKPKQEAKSTEDKDNQNLS